MILGMRLLESKYRRKKRCLAGIQTKGRNFRNLFCLESIY